MAWVLSFAFFSRGFSLIRCCRLDRQTSIRSLPPDRHSTWTGVVASSETLPPRSSPLRNPNDSDSSDDDWGWTPDQPVHNEPVILLLGPTPKPAHQSPRVVPGGLKYQLSVASTMSPTPAQSPYLYSSPRMDSSPYVPAWSSPLHIPSNPPSRPVSRAYSSASNASPYMQTHTGPF